MDQLILTNHLEYSYSHFRIKMNYATHILESLESLYNKYERCRLPRY